MIFKSEDDIKAFEERVDSIKEDVDKGEIDSKRLTNILDNILDSVKDTHEYIEAKSEALEKAAVEYESTKYELINFDAYEWDGDYSVADDMEVYVEKLEEVVENIKNDEYDVEELKEIKDDVEGFIENSHDKVANDDDSPTYEGEDGADDEGDDDGSGSVDNEGDW